MVGATPPEQSPPVEYYGDAKGQPPAAYAPPPAQSTSPPQEQPKPQMRRLHSEGHRKLDIVPNIPEAVSPVQSSPGQSSEPAQSPIGEQTTSQGMSQQPQPATARPALDTRQSSAYSQASVLVFPVSTSAPDNFPQATGRQDYQTQYWQHQNQSQRSTPAVSPVQAQVQPVYQQHQSQSQRKAPAVSPLQTQVQPMYQQQPGVGSIDQQMARSPARDYQDQQTPYAISLPQGQDALNRSPDPSSWAQQPPSQPSQGRYIGPPAAARGAVRSTSPPQRDQYSSMTPYQFVPPQQMQHMAPQSQQRGPSYYGDQVSSPTAYTPTSPQQRVASPAAYTPTSPQSSSYGYGSTQQHQHSNSGSYPPPPRQRSQGPQSQNRYYGQQQQRQPSYDHEARPLTYQRTPSGYSGRRDDAGLSEDQIMNMRGASYPGQEWTPGR